MQLRYYQEEAVQALFDFFNDPVRAHSLEPANPLVCLPTGTGKSLVIGEFARRAMAQYPGTRIFIATHVKTLIEQNAAKMLEIWPLAPLGIYSAGLKQRDSIQPIIFGGIQSVVGKYPLFGRRDLLIIDEAHLLSPNTDTSYGKFIDELRQGPPGATANSHNTNPFLKVIGLTATPYRLGLGLMTNGNIFTHIAYDLCNMDGFNRLIAEGFICPLIPKRTETQLDVSNVGMAQGEFAQNELQAAVDKDSITYAALKETVELGQDRKSWLIFASGVQHANHICDMLNSAFGIPCGIYHSNTKDYPRTDKQNKTDYDAWKSGELRAIVNMNSLTTGVDHPPCDLIAMLRPTMSTGLWVQMLGRGTRPSPGKENCLVLDFARNTRRLGPINDPVIPKLKSQGPPGDAPVRICIKCNSYNHATAKVCVVCGYEFPVSENIAGQASELELIRSNLPQMEWFPVKRVTMAIHHSRHSGKDSIKIGYACGLRMFYEYISVESDRPFFKHKSRDWFRQRYHYADSNLTWDKDVPETNAEVIALSDQLRWPKKIKVWVNSPSLEIKEYEF